WLDGYGLVIIIDHGGNYMSVYGYNNTLIPSVGEWVSSGDVIATAGETGGQSRTGLFFGVRYSARPNDPIVWLKRR
ncbi:MAG: murein hydrolase activator EnvC family protein, partial [Pontibacterium sp.]